jgi:hypothetical protein
MKDTFGRVSIELEPSESPHLSRSRTPFGAGRAEPSESPCRQQEITSYINDPVIYRVNPAGKRSLPIVHTVIGMNLILSMAWRSLE